jgi:outer membrane protein assembly factor BamB
LPPEWKLTARDAFNGTQLWQRSIDDWHTHLWPLKSGPAQLPRRLVAVGDRVFITLGLDAPLAVLDAATGETIRVFQQTRAAEEVLYCDGVLLCLVHENPTSRPWATMPSYAGYDQLRTEPETWAWKEDSRSIVAIAEDSGELLWKKTSVVAPLTLATDAIGVFFHDGTKVVCLDRSTGQQKWASQPIAQASDMRSWFAPTLVVKDGVVVFAGGENIVRHRGGIDTMTALSAETGAVLWTAEHPPSGYDSPKDVLIVDGLVWTAPITNRRDTGFYTGRDLQTGEVKRSFPADDGDHMPHHRCHRAKATERFILASRTGIEYVDLQAEHWNRNDWVRGACLYGIMPANGLTYAPPQSCACYIVSKLNGLNALAPARTAEGEVDESEDQKAERSKREDALRLVRGPAFRSMDGTLFGTDVPWPTYRCDAARSGWTKTRVASGLRLGWGTEIGGQLSSPVIAEGKVFVAAVDRHAVHALDEHSGQLLWTFTAGARVDSPPTVWQGRVLFGCRDGCVYCLTAFDGSLVWRFRAAATDQQLVAFEQF